MNPIEVLFLSQEEIAAAGLTMKAAIDIVEGAFADHGRGLFENPPKPGIHPRQDAFIHAMPAYLPRQSAAGVKWVSGYSGNPGRGLPNIIGLLVLNDVDTGRPLAIMEAGLITAVRTAAVSGVAARYLARPEAETLGIVGAGVQGRYHLLALTEVLPGLKRVMVYDTHRPTLRAYVDGFSGRLPVTIAAAESAQAVIRAADVVVTATGRLEETVYHEAWVQAGALVLPVHMFGWDPGFLTAADMLVVDDWNQFRPYIERHGRQYTPLPHPQAELGQIVIGAKPGRPAGDARILNFNLGIAIHDVAIGAYVLKRARAKNLGTCLRLLSQPTPFAL